MPVSPSFRTFILDQLSRVAPRVRGRSMFGGVGIYAGELFFALIAAVNPLPRLGGRVNLPRLRSAAATTMCGGSR